MVRVSAAVDPDPFVNIRNRRLALPARSAGQMVFQSTNTALGHPRRQQPFHGWDFDTEVPSEIGNRGPLARSEVVPKIYEHHWGLLRRSQLNSTITTPRDNEGDHADGNQT